MAQQTYTSVYDISKRVVPFTGTRLGYVNKFMERLQNLRAYSCQILTVL
jgi:hypothetical protein